MKISEEKSYLSRALGASSEVELDYRAVQVAVGELFLLATDGVYEFLSDQEVIGCLASDPDLDVVSKKLVAQALSNGSDDNLTAQVVRIEELPEQSATELYKELTELPFSPELGAGVKFDGYAISRQLHGTSRSHVFFALDEETSQQVVLKIPAVDVRQDAAYLERFLMEEWIARRIDNAHVLRAITQTRKRNFVYLVSEFLYGQNLAQWMIDNPKPSVEAVRDIVEQIARGLLAFHRLEMLHQDLRPENIMIDGSGTVKIIDFGSARAAGIEEISTHVHQPNLLGTAQYTAPEYFLGEFRTPSSDIFSLGVITYRLLSGRLPYGTQVAKARTRVAQRNLKYTTVLQEDREIPAWMDETLKKAVHPDPQRRYNELSEFVYDLRHPSKEFLSRSRPPLLERNPAQFWKGVSLLLAVVIVVLLLSR